MLKAYKFRLYPNRNQIQLFEKHFGCVRFIYNWALEHRSSKYEFEGVSTSWYSLIKILPIIKFQLPWLKEVNSQSLQQAVKHLDNAYQNFFNKRSGYPRFKSKSNKQSFSVPQNVKVNYDAGTVSVPKIKNIKTVLHRKIKGTIKSATVSKTPSEKYFISILVEDNQLLPEKEQYTPSTTIGVDLGIKTFATLSNGTKIENPKHLVRSERRLKRFQRRLNRKKKCSSNRRKARLLLAKCHEKVSNQRKDFLHKLSKKLVSENQAIALEDLNVSGMVKNHKLAKHIQDASWRTFREYVTYKCNWYSKTLITIDRFEPSSKFCRHCGSINENLTLSDRNWVCSCGVEHDRDINAAINIKLFALNRAGTARINACEDHVRPFEEVSASSKGRIVEARSHRL